MRARSTAVLLAVIAVAGVGVGAPAAQASDHPSGVAASSTAHSAAGLRTDDPPAGYTYEGNFYWHDSCEEAGKGGIPRAWSAYVCLGDGWVFDSYNLYVKYN